MNKLAKKILKKIEQQALKPRPHWLFIVRNILLWLLLLLWVAVGSLASAMVIDSLRFNDWQLAWQLGHHLIIRSLPLFWLTTLLLTIVILRSYFRKTRHGYRHSLIRITIDGLIISLLLGTIIAYSGLGKQINQNLAQRPLYHRLNCQDYLWHRPDQGLLIGQILNQKSTVLQIVAFDNSIWTININEKTIQSATPTQIGQSVKIIGQITGPQIFTAREIRQHQNHCGCQKCNCSTGQTCQSERK